ncbi:glucose 1-dehydrogenase [Paraburkholderia sp. BL10I2N1]|uniref:SDR family NAD(P)-dependent oxidoreductase n=1 Tax=Paraburkholderia sp. BL10I2N1 TaxID=1938796 RepID=UPI00105C831B|nr:glucose 1-dehydrogenase [Paraburkholderia sp. BL10I2N1]TDN61947.1 NAD(P)-dependent dehydrogenase (short-subunit alcohol dehydrogenase family) [Paraburkholderia sp. BL10I2N1]
MGKLDGKVALISGAAGGFGAELVRVFAREGAAVVAGDIVGESGEQLEREVHTAGGRAKYCHLDVTLEKDWGNAVQEAISRFGKLDILVNNAGIVPRNAPIEERTVEEWDRVMAVNARGVFLGTRFAIPAMREAGGGSIVNVSSVAAIGQSQIMEAAYAASKGAVRIFSKVTAAQHAKDAIRCNSVHPGPIDTGLLRGVLSNPEILNRRLGRIPLGRLGKIKEVVAGVLYLASDEASYTTGTELVIDGGALAQ